MGERIAFAEAVRVWVRVALLSFGGPAGQIAVMHRLLVSERRWVSESRFLHALNYCMLLPGPEAQQLATYVGWLLHGWRGGLTAGLLFVLPGFLSILALSVLYAGFGELALVAALFFGLKPAVVAIVVEAVVRIGRKTLRSAPMVALAVGAFVAIHLLEAPFPLIVAAAGALGWLTSGRASEAVSDGGEGEATEVVAAGGEPVAVRPSLSRSLRVATVWLGLWLGPLAALGVLLGPSHVLVREGVFFSQTAVVTFGGAYAVLAFVAQRAVDVYGWLAPGEMLDGLGMAETTPGPLIQVVQFVGFMGAYRHPGELDPMLAGFLGALVTTWVTFAPCFLWIFLGAPYVESLRGHVRLNRALSAITAAVVGVILNLAVWFSLHTLFGEVGEWRGLGVRLLVPDVSTLDPAAAAITVGAFVALFGLRLGMARTLVVCAVAGAVVHLALR